MSPYDLSPEARKHLANFSRDDYYTYIRPTSSKWAEPSKKEGQWWVVSVQIRSLPPHEFREEGRSLDECIRKLGERVPRRKDLDTPMASSGIGFLAPHRQWQKEYARIRQEGTERQKAAMQAEKKARKAGNPFDRRGEAKPLDATEKGHGLDKVKSKKKAKKRKKK